MHSLIESVNQKQMKARVTDVRSGDTVRVHQTIKEGGKERTQVFEGMVIGTRRSQSHSATIAVRRIASGVGVEKTFLIHSPLVTKIEVTRRANVRRDKLNYMRARSGKSARLAAVDFDREAVNATDVVVEEAEQTPVEVPDEVAKEESTQQAEAIEEVPAATEIPEAVKEEDKQAN